MPATVSAVPSDMVRTLMEAGPLRALSAAAEKHAATLASGLWGSSVAAAAAAVGRHTGRPVLLVCGHVDEADDLADDVELFAGERPEVLVALETAGGLGQASEELVADRLRLLGRLAGKGKTPPYLVSPIQALMQAVPDPSELKHLTRVFRAGQEIEPEKIIVWLSDHGYNRLDHVEVPGDFAVRGGIVDVYLPGKFDTADSSGLQQIGLPVRVDFFGDQIETIKRFNIDTLGSEGSLPDVELVDLKGKLNAGGTTSALRYLPDETVVFLWAPLEIAEQAKSYLLRAPDQRGLYPLSAVLKLLGKRHLVEASQFDAGGVSLVSDAKPAKIVLPVRSLQRFETEPKKALQELGDLSRSHKVAVFCENAGEQNRFRELLQSDVSDAADDVATPLGYLHRGFVFGESDEGESDDPPLALVGHHEIFHRYELRRRVSNKGVATKQIDSFLDLNVGDYVVHVAHGIAKFTGMQTIEKEGKHEEYLTLRFADNAALHVPASRINLIQKYVGGFSGHPTLSKLGGTQWEKQKEKVSEAVADMAAELLDVQASRAAQVGHPFPADTDWQHEFEAEFPYTPTEDQVAAADDIKSDMTKPRPMDRLLCGDVGYGKTEMAMRGAFKAAESGKQVAVLVPTTVLAEQHERSFRERMANYPFRVESLSRFKNPKQTKLILEGLAAGDVDVVIGTHKLLGKQIKFSDLGLVVIDEEQRFGVTHKERLKQLRTQVDVLTMSATPIPRTLHMSMLGLRDISSLTTAPQDRRSIVTEVLAYDANRIKLAMLRELQRDGQIYFVHNRVSNIYDVAASIRELVPDARIIVGHGQMEEGALEKVMLKFIRHEADILVSHDDHRKRPGHPQRQHDVHQRRRPFRPERASPTCAVASGGTSTVPTATSCSRPIVPSRPSRRNGSKPSKNSATSGAGFKIAMRDLELRGAGNILGPEQSGHIAAVGYEMYCQLLEEATQQLKNEKKPVKPEAHVEIDLNAFIPKTYIAADRQRMDAYRRLTRCTSVEMIGDLQRDLADAFGEPPRAMTIMYALTELRLLASHFGIDSVVRKQPDVVLTVRDAKKAQIALAKAPGTLRVIDEKTVYFRPPAVFIEPEPLLLTLRNLLMKAYDAEKPVVESTAA